MLTMVAVPANARSLKYCKFQTVSRGFWTDAEVARTVRCMANREGVSAWTALCIANRESGFEPRAWNSYSGAAGVFQHLIRYWPSRVSAYRATLRRYDVKHAAWYNPRANTAVAMAMARTGGWGPWTTSGSC
jgi:hypothetical protein